MKYCQNPHIIAQYGISWSDLLCVPIRITLSTIAEECTPARNNYFEGYKSWVAWFKELRSSFERLKIITLSRRAFLTFVEVFDCVLKVPNIYDEGRYISLTPWSTTVE